MRVANARMYAASLAAEEAWRALLAHVSAAAGVPLRYEPHAAPQPLAALWRRPDLGCALMCGYPWSTWRDAALPRPIALAVPMPAGSPGAQYRTAIVVRGDSRWQSVGELRGARFAYTTPDSQSGYQAPRRLFAAMAGGRPYFGSLVGPLQTPRRVLDAVLDGRADAGPLDGYWLDLLRVHEPQLAAGVRVLTYTEWTPAPLFVGSGALPADVVQRLRSALLAAGSDPALAAVRAGLALAGIAAAEPSAYDSLPAAARAADALGYPQLQ